MSLQQKIQNMCAYNVGKLYKNGVVIRDGKFKVKEGQVRFSKGYSTKQYGPQQSGAGIWGEFSTRDGGLKYGWVPGKGMARGIKICACCQGNLPDDDNRHKLCGGCKKARYCNSECQRKHWRDHKAVCKQYAADKKLPAGIQRDI